MPTTANPFPLDIVPKENTPELEAWFAQFGFQLYLSAEEIMLIIQGMQYLYENIDPTANPNLLQLGETATTAYRGDRGKEAYDYAINHNNVNNTSDMNKPVSTAQAAADAVVANNAHTYADSLITGLKDGVATPGNTLLKLYNLILGGTSEVVVANITERNAYNIPHLPFQIFVTDDGDGKWAKYQATTTGTNATYVKLSDPDLLNAVMSASAIKIAYESNADTNAFTNALKTKLNAISGTNTGDQDLSSLQPKILNKQISTSTYTLLDSDSNYFLLFSNTCVVTIPNNLLNIQFQGMQIGYNLPVSFVGSGVTLVKPATENAITAEQFSPFAIRYLYGTTYSLYGRLQQI